MRGGETEPKTFPNGDKERGGEADERKVDGGEGWGREGRRRRMQGEKRSRRK